MKINPNDPIGKSTQVSFNNEGRLNETHFDGISIRAHFASMAMQGYASADNIANSGMPVEMIAEWSVAMADALIAELNKEK